MSANDPLDSGTSTCLACLGSGCPACTAFAKAYRQQVEHQRNEQASLQSLWPVGQLVVFNTNPHISERSSRPPLMSVTGHKGMLVVATFWDGTTFKTIDLPAQCLRKFSPPETAN